MKAPIYFLYKLGNFYQNHRRYIQSKNNYQLAGNIIYYKGNTIDLTQASVCSPKITNADMNQTQSWTGVALDPNAIASPCGYIGNHYLLNNI